MQSDTADAARVMHVPPDAGADDDRLSIDALRAIAAFAKHATDPAASDLRGALPASALLEAKRMGLFGLSIPRRYGGLGLGLEGVCSAIEAVAFHDRALAATLGLHNGLGTRAIVAFGPDSLRAAYLPRLASGDSIAAFAATEPSAGSDVAALQTTVRLGADGRLHLDGSKAYITNGGLAGVFTVLARHPGVGGAPRAHSMVLVERGQAGFTIGGEERKLGLRASSTTPLTFEDVAVDTDRVVGEPGAAMVQLEHALAWGRIVMASGCCGAARSALDRTIEHVTTRIQFARRLADLEVVRSQVADMAARHFTMRALAGHAAACAGGPRGLTTSLAAKVACSEMLWLICDTAVQLHGGLGYMEGSGLPLLLRDARVMRIFEGASDVLLTQAGAAEVREPRVRTRPGAAVPATLAEALARHDRRVAEVRDGLVRAFGVRLLAKHAELHRLGRLVVLVEALDAVVGRVADQSDAHATRLACHWAALAETEAQTCIGASSADSIVALTDALYAAGHA